jgi:chitin disaccharide deacetylase
VKRISCCADDFGHGPQVNAGILQLVGLGRLGAVSCQVAAPAFAADAPALVSRAGNLDLGLHLDLAPGRGGLAVLLARSAARALSRQALARVVTEQLDAFERVVGRPPDFVDGHQHVHQLAVVRDVLLDALAARYGAPGPVVRNTVPLRYLGAKPITLAALGGLSLRRTLTARKVRHNADFVGVYDLAPGADYRSLARRWLAAAADGALLMCHPGLTPADDGDPIGPARAIELAYLASPAFDADCAAAGVRRVRLTSLA